MSLPPPVRLLLVEDDRSIGEPLADALDREGFGVVWVQTGAEALAASGHDLVLLDLGLPDLDGREVCRRLRAAAPVPIIVVTARDDEVERVVLLEMGADDYVLKPFGFRELVARIRAVLRRSVPPQSVPPQSVAPPQAVADGGLVVDVGSRRARLRGVEVELTPKEFDLLVLLASAPGRALAREAIMSSVWDEHWWGSTKTLDVHIAALRRKLGEPGWITTLRNVGYRFDPPAGIGSEVLGAEP